MRLPISGRSRYQINNSMKKIFEYTLVIVFLIPLFFINIKTSHDWGDDFALYIKQAKNINAGISQNETGYILNENCFIAPQAYPAGFPLLLSLVTQNMQDINYQTLDLYITFFLALTCFVGFLILRNYFSFIAALATTLVIAYNPVFLHFKTEILSDLPFAFFSMLGIYLMLQKENYFIAVLLGLIMGFSAHIRSIGVISLGVFVIHKLFIENNIKSFSLKTQLHTITTVATSALIYFLIKFSFPCDSNYPFMETERFWQSINNHLSYNLHHLAWMFGKYELKDYYFINIVATSCLIAFSILGFVYFFKNNKRSVINLYVVAYLFAIISYQFSDAGMRFLFPILFFIFLYAIIGLKQSLANLNVNNRVFAVAVGILILFSYKDEIEKITHSENEIIDGPEIPEAQTIFKFINDSIPEKSVIACASPKLLALYTHAKSLTFNCSNSDEYVLNEIKKFRPEYILHGEGLTSEAVKNFILRDTALLKPIYSNTRFTLYRIAQ